MRPFNILQISRSTAPFHRLQKPGRRFGVCSNFCLVRVTPCVSLQKRQISTIKIHGPCLTAICSHTLKDDQKPTTRLAPDVPVLFGLLLQRIDVRPEDEVFLLLPVAVPIKQLVIHRHEAQRKDGVVLVARVKAYKVVQDNELLEDVVVDAGDGLLVLGQETGLCVGDSWHVVLASCQESVGTVRD